MNDHIGKPLDMGIVLEKIRKYWIKDHGKGRKIFNRHKSPKKHE